jgi:hypothetical protein
MAAQGYSMPPQGNPDGSQVQLAQATGPVAGEGVPEGAVVAEDGTMYVGPDGQYPSDGCEQPAVAGFGHAPVFGWQPPPWGTRIRNLLPSPYEGLGCQDGCGPGLFGDKIVSRLGHIYVKADALMWRRTNPGGSTQLVQEDVDPVTGASPGSTLVTTGSYQFKNELGQRITLGISQSERSNIEVTYWCWRNSIATTGAVETANLDIGGPPGFGFPPPLVSLAGSPFNSADSMQTSVSTRIYNAEVNYLATSVFDRFIFLGGFRTIQIYDHLTLNSYTSNGGLLTDVGLFDLPIRNEMYGGQLGFILRQNFDLLTFELTSKSGVYNDHATMRSYIAGTVPGVIRDMATSSNAASFVQEFSMNMTYHFTSALGLRLGYQTMWLDNMALAANNVDLTNSANSATIIHRGQNLFLYGMNLGLDARF